MSRHAILTRDEHSAVRIRTEHSAELGDAVQASFTVPLEFRRIQHDFPILFRRDPATARFSALALFGFEAGENLFLEGDRWTSDYKPMAIAVQPFLVGRSTDADAPIQLHIDLEHPRISTTGEGLLLFDSAGAPTPFLEGIGDMLAELHAGHRASESFFAALARYELLEPFSLDVQLRDGSQHRMVGYHLINEEKLRELDPEAVVELHSEGHLLPIFMALASLSNLPKLIAHKSQRDSNG